MKTSKFYNFIVIVSLFFNVISFSKLPAQEANQPGQSTNLELPGSIGELNSPFIKDGKLDIDAAIKHFEDLYRSTSSISEVELKIKRPGNERTLGMKIWTKGQEKALIVIQSPAREKDTATLKVDDNLWNYLPRINRTIRIPPSLMMSAWMGSDFTNDDLVRESSFSEDYTYKLIGHSDNPKGWQIDLIARPDIVGLWNKFELIVSEDGTIPLQAKYYDRKDRLSRTIVWSDVKDFDGHIIPSKMELIPEDEKDQKTEMIYTDIDFNVNVPDNMFSLSQLEKNR